MTVRALFAIYAAIRTRRMQLSLLVLQGGGRRGGRTHGVCAESVLGPCLCHEAHGYM